MKFLKKYKWIISSTLVIIFIIFSIPKLILYIEGYKLKKELYKSSSLIDIGDMSFKGLELLDSDLKNNEIFFAGESHGSVKSMEMHLYLLKYLVEKGDIRYLLWEGGYTQAEFLNEYLQSGDDDILNYIIDSIRGTASYTEENYNLLKCIYEFNKELPDDKKIKFVGVDIEHQPKVAIRYIRSIIPDEEPREDIREFVSMIRTMGSSNYQRVSKQLVEMIGNNENSIKEYMGDKFFNLSFALKNLSISEGQAVREEYIISNFIEQYENLPKGKYFGQFGSFHTGQEGTEDVNGNKPFAAFLDKEYEFTKGKVISINYDYLNSKVYLPQTGEEYSIPCGTVPEFYPEDGSTMLVKLNNEGSIFTRKSIFVMEHPTTDYYEYIMLFSNSESAKKYYIK